jgi:ABC-type branched-subunit amino acid transport system substrate-binding protein
MSTKIRFSTLLVSALALAVILACQLFPLSTPEAPTPGPVAEIKKPTPEPPGGALNGSESFSNEVVLQMMDYGLVEFPGIAVQGPMTGQFSEYFDHMWNVVNMAVMEFNLTSTMKVPLPANLEVDDRCEESGGASAAEPLLRDYPDVVGVIGPFCSAAARGSLPIYNQAGLVSISGSATRDDLSTLFGSGGFFNRTVYNDGQLQDLGIPEDWVDSIKEVQDFYARYESHYGPIPAEIRPLMAYTYDAVHVLIYAVEEVAIQNTDGSITIERAALAQAVRHIEGFSGITGLIEFDQDGDRVP